MSCKIEGFIVSIHISEKTAAAIEFGERSFIEQRPACVYCVYRTYQDYG